MSTPIPPDTTTWLHNAARNGSSMAQTMLVVLERLDALEHLPAPEAAPAPPLIVPDTRRPGALLPPLPLRLEPAVIVELDGQAARLGCSRVALIRALLAQGVAQLREADRTAAELEAQSNG